jgi:transaldolase
MEIFLDSIDVNEIRKYYSYGMINGVTTNPSLLTKSSKGFYEILQDICSAVNGDVSIEIPSNDYESMLIDGKKILKAASNIVVKLPVTWDGIRACRYFIEGGHKVNMTLCFSANQALLAAKAGATYISPFIGRLDDIGSDGMQLIRDIRDIYDNYEFETKILASSIRSSDHVLEAAIWGADVVTMSEKILSQLIDHKLTNEGLERFNSDWEKSGMKI